MSFGLIQFTNKGLALKAKAEIGAELVFTRIGIGDGSMSGQSIYDMTDLINEVASLNITKLKALPGGKAVVGGYFTNEELQSGFWWREIALFAMDPNLGEIMYCYGNAGTLAEYIPSPGGSEIIEKHIDMIAIIGNASSVSASIEQSLVFVTMDDLQAGISSEATARENADIALSESINALLEEISETIIPVTRGGTGRTTAYEALIALGMGYGTCTTAAGTAAKAVTLSGFSLVTGGIIAVKFTYANTATAATLNVNGTGAKSIFCNGSTLTSGQITAGMMALFQYDDNYWQLLNPAYPAGVTPIANGGTGATTAAAARTALGLSAAGSYGKYSQMSGGAEMSAAGVISFTKEDKDDFNAINIGSSASKITIPAGVTLVRFYFNGTIRIEGGRNWMNVTVSLLKNAIDMGNVIKFVEDGYGGELTQTVFTMPISCVAGDYFQLSFASYSNVCKVYSGSIFGMEVLA